MKPIILFGVEYTVDDSCGHCRHRLTWHVESDGLVQCAMCHCLRRPGEDVLKPHNFGGAA